MSGASYGALVGGGVAYLGPHRLKDLLQPIRLYQLEVDGLPAEFPPLRSLHQTNLPVAAWPLLGREPELAEIRDLVRDGLRLVTLTGPGGSGKTRLALQAAAELSDQFTDGVFFVALAPLRETTMVLGAVAEAVGLQADDDVVAWLRSRRVLLVLDNLEHLQAVETVVAELLVGEVVVLATSRAPLHLSSERELPVEPLPEEAAVELFVSRAAAAGRQVEADATVVEVCRRLDNLPLAIELAAARVKLLSPAALLQRLDAALPLLSGGARDLPERQQTLRATIEWSHDLLSAEEQRLFARFSVFAGGCTLEAVATVCDAELDVLQWLVDKSLVYFADSRFSMLETIREFALERLERADQKREFARRHAGYYAALAEELRDDHSAQADRMLASEVPNIRAALVFAQAQGDVEIQLRLLTADRGTFGADSLDDFADALEEALHQRVGDVTVRGRAESALAHVEYRRGNYAAARAAAERALDLGEQASDKATVTSALNVLGTVAVTAGDFPRASVLHERVLEIHRAANDEHGAAIALINLGDVALVAGEYQRAIDLTTEAIELIRDRGDTPVLQVPLINLAAAHAHLGHVEDAEEAATLSLTAAADFRDPIAVIFALRVFGAIAASRRDGERAALLVGAADALDANLGARSDPSQQALRKETVRRLEALSRDGTFEARVQKHPLSLEEALELALSGQNPQPSSLNAETNSGSEAGT